MSAWSLGWKRPHSTFGHEPDLWQHGYTTVNIKGGKKSRLASYNALEKVQLHHDPTDFQLLVVDYALASLKTHLELAG